MIATACFLTFIAFYLFYQTSEKVKFTSPGFLNRKIKGNRNVAKIAALALFILVLGLFIILNGVGAGTLYFFITLMAAGSLVVLLAPLQLFSAKHIIPLFIVCLFVEYFLTY